MSPAAAATRFSSGESSVSTGGRPVSSVPANVPR